jgi:hypothetical protein
MQTDGEYTVFCVRVHVSVIQSVEANWRITC